MKKNGRWIILNTLIVMILAAVGFYVFFKIENTIYDYDYVGHWYRALIMKEKFFLDPFSVLEYVQNSLNYDVYYSQLTAFYQLPLIILNESYAFFSLGSFLMFYVPSFVCLQVLYFTHFDKHKFLPALIAIALYPLYIVFFNGETECFGFLMLLMCFMLSSFIKFDEIDMVDNLSINAFAFLLILGRRFYLYALIMMYFSYFVHYLDYYHFKSASKKALFDFMKIISSGLILLGLCLSVYYPFFLRVVTNNYGEIYAYNNRPGKLLAFVQMFSPLVLLISCYGCYILMVFKKKHAFCVSMILSLVIPTFLFWRVQSFERHHYYLIALPIVVFFAQGMYSLFSQKKTAVLKFFVSAVLLAQVGHVFFFDHNVFPLLTPHMNPKYYWEKDRVIEFYDYLSSLCADGNYVFMATGDGNLNTSTLMNSKLPELPSINIEEKSNDIIDGFPDMQNIKYVVVSSPITYLSQEYQHMYDIITEAIMYDEYISSFYELIDERVIHDVTYFTYSLEVPYTDEVKLYFYEKMVEFYPNYADFFSSILQ